MRENQKITDFDQALTLWIAKDINKKPGVKQNTQKTERYSWNVKNWRHEYTQIF